LHRRACLRDADAARVAHLEPFTPALG
jgi:hypothetical protein